MGDTFNLKNEALSRSLVETIVWCGNQQVAATAEESEEVKGQRMLGQQAAELTQRAYTQRDSFWNKIIRRDYTDTRLWRRGMELHRQANLSSVAPLKEQLRTPALRPSFSLAEVREDQERQAIVHSVIVKRVELIRSHFPEHSENIGRLLLYSPAESLADGAAQYASKGFFDVDNMPPWDTWVAFSHGTLLSWVPPQLERLVQSGIDANPECCIRWMDSKPLPVG